MNDLRTGYSRPSPSAGVSDPVRLVRFKRLSLLYKKNLYSRVPVEAGGKRTKKSSTCLTEKGTATPRFDNNNIVREDGDGEKIIFFL